MNKLLGKWQMRCWNYNTPDGWKTFRRFRSGEQVWEFQPHGVLVERKPGQKPVQRKYRYDEEAEVLMIEYQRKPARYRLDFVNFKYAIFYDFDIRVIDSEEHLVTMELEKLMGSTTQRFFLFRQLLGRASIILLWFASLATFVRDGL